MSFEQHMKSMPKKAKKKTAKKVEQPKPIEKPAVVEKPVAPIIKVIEQPNYSPALIEQSKTTNKLAEQAIASMRDSVNNNQAVLGEIIRILTDRPTPVRFDIKRDGKGDMASLTPIYGKQNV